MIGVALLGRFGNQMFQYALAVRITSRLNTKFFMIENEFFPYIIGNYFELPSCKPLSRIFRERLFRLRKKDPPIVVFDPRKSFEENKALLDKDDCIYNGYFQSEHYFKEVFPQLQKEFKIKNKYLVDVKKVLNIFNDKPLLVLHVRRTDYLGHGDDSLGGADMSLPPEYYKKCLSLIDDHGNYNIVFVTDDPDHVKEKYKEYDPIVSSSADLIVDFQILLAADILVIANSSFSWWGAYLNTRKKRVLSPRYWLGFRIKKDYPTAEVIPDSWEKIEF
jgi:hypothetical protein